MQAKIDELWPQTHVTVHGFPILRYFVHNYTHNPTAKGHKRTFLPIERLLYYRRYPVTWLELYTRNNWRVMNPNTHRNHFLIRHFVSTYTRKSKTTGRMPTFYIIE